MTVPPSTHRSRRIAALGGLGLVLAVGAFAVIAWPLLASYRDSLDPAFALVLFPGLAWYWALGAVIVLRADGHLVGWLFAISSAMVSSVFVCWVAGPILAEGDANAHGWFVLAGALLFPTALLLALPGVMLTFPTGRLPGPGWRWPVLILAGMTVLGALATMLRPGMVDGTTPNPLTPFTSGLPPSVVDVLGLASVAGNLTVPLGLLLGLAAVIVRFHASRGVERTQLKWLLAAAVPAAILIPLSLSDAGQAIPGIDAISALSVPLLALAVAIAILRYRLYDIDRIISRTIAYAGVTLALFALFAVVNIGAQAVLAPFVGGDGVATAISTLVVAAAFSPVRGHAQRVVDRRFNRARYDQERTLESFSAGLREDLDVDRVLEQVRETVERAVEPRMISVWSRDGGPS